MKSEETGPKKVRQDAFVSALRPTELETKCWLLLDLEHNHSADQLSDIKGL